MILLCSWKKQNSPADEVILDTIDTAFSSIKSLSKQKDIKEPDVIVANRRDVLDMFAHLIGKISSHKFDFVVDRFYHELERAIDSNNIPEVTALLSGIRYLRLSYQTEEELEKSKKFIDFIGKNISKKTKPEVLSSCCAAYGEVLLPLSDSEEVDSVNYTSFRESITEMFYTTKKLWKKLKEPTPGLIMEVGILCNGKKDFLAQQPFSVLERLSKVAKLSDKNRSTILDCTYYLLMTMFTKYDNADYDISFDLILEKMAREIFPPSSKKLIIPHMESVEAYVDIVSLLSIFRLDYCVKNFVHDAVNTNDSNYERILSGMKIFNAMADRCAVSFDKTNLIGEIDDEISNNNDYSRRKQSLNRVNYTIKKPSNLSTEDINRFRNELEQILLLVDSQVGDLLLYNQPQDRKYTDYEIARVKYLPKERQPLILLLRTCIDCIRRVPPATIEISKIIQMLSKYCFHLDTEVRSQAREVLLGILKTKPTYRPVLIEVFAAFLIKMPENQEIYIHKGVEILLELLASWHDPVVLNAVDPDLDFFVIPGKTPNMFPSGVLEGAALTLLCNMNTMIRSDALSILEWTKRVNEGLPRNICDPTPGVNMILLENEKEILSRINNDPTLLSAETMDSLLPPNIFSLHSILISQNTDELQTSIARCIGEIVRAIRPNCNRSLQVAFTFAQDKLEQILNSIIINAKRADTPGFIEQLILWRNYCTIVGGSGSLGSDGLAKITATLNSPLQIVRDCTHYVLYYMNLSSIVIVSSQIVSDIKRKKEFIRLELSHVFRVICDKRVFESKDKNVSLRCMDFFNETANFLSSLTEVQWHLQLYLSYDLFRCVALFFEFLKKKKPKDIIISKELRELLFNQGIRYSGFGSYRSEQKIREQKIKELCPPDKLKETEKHLQFMQYWAIRSIHAVVCQSTDDFTSSSEDLSESGAVFSLVTDIFENCKNKKLINIVILLIKELIHGSSNHQEEMFKICIDKSFLISSPNVSYGYFKTVVDIITSNIDTNCKLSEILTLAIFKLSDDSFEVRKSACKMLHWMSTRFFRTSEDTFKMYRSIDIDFIYDTQMLSITKSFSNKHPELRIEILREIMNRIGGIDRSGQRRMMEMIDSLFHGVHLNEYDDDSINEILQYLTVFTHNHCDRINVLQSLWFGFIVQEENFDYFYNFMINNILERQQTILLNAFRKIISLFSFKIPIKIHEYLINELNNPDYGAQLPSNPIKKSPTLTATAWNFENLFQKKQMSTQITRRSFSMILCSDIICNNYKIFENNISKILNAVFVEMDSDNHIVSKYSKILLENIVHAHVIHYDHKENSDSDKAMKVLFDLLDSSNDDGPFWPKETVTLQNFNVPSADFICEIVNLILKVLTVNFTSLKEDWSSAAIKWAVHDTSTHVSARCLQIYRALAPSLNENHLNSIIAKLLQSIQTRSPINVEISIEIMATLKVVPKSTPRNILLSIPQLFWTAASMLNTVICQEFCSAVQLTSALVDRMKIHSLETQKTILQTIPQSWTPPFEGIIIYLLKGLCSPKTEEVSRDLLAKISDLPCIIPFHIDTELRVLGNIIGLCPHLLTCMGRDNTLCIADQLAVGLLYFGEKKLSKLFHEYSKYTTSAEGMRRFIHELGSAISERFFPTHEIFVFNVLVEMMENGPSCHQRSILSLLEILLKNTDLQRSPLYTSNLSLLAPSTKYFNGSHWREALMVMKVVLAKSSDHSKQKPYKNIPVKEDLDRLQISTATWERFANIEPLTKALKEALSPTINPNPPEPFIPEEIPEEFKNRVTSRSSNLASTISSTSSPQITRSEKRSSNNSLSQSHSPNTSAASKKWAGSIKPTRMDRENSVKNIGYSRSQTTSESDSGGTSPHNESKLSSSLGSNSIAVSSSDKNVESPEPPSRPARPDKPPPTNPRMIPKPAGEFRAPLPNIARGASPAGRGIRGPGPPRGRGNIRGSRGRPTA